MTVEQGRLIVLGAAGHGREIARLLRVASTRVLGRAGQLAGFLDDDPTLQGTTVDDLPVLGTLDWEPLHVSSGVMGVGYPETKHRMRRRLDDSPIFWPWVVSASSLIGEDTLTDAGVVVQSGCVITAGVHLCEFATVNIAVSLSHDVRIGPFATVSPGANIGGNVQVGEGAFIGIGASVIQGITIGEWSVVGAGAVVTRDVEPNSVVAGVPARVISRREPGWQNA